jgi:hypothetical protein
MDEQLKGEAAYSKGARFAEKKTGAQRLPLQQSSAASPSLLDIVIEILTRPKVSDSDGIRHASANYRSLMMEPGQAIRYSPHRFSSSNDRI